MTNRLNVVNRTELARTLNQVLPVVEIDALFLNDLESRHIMRDSPHLVKAIEVTLLACVHEKTLIDDLVVAKALACSIEHAVDRSELVSFVIVKLALSANELNADDSEWRAAMRAVHHAVRARSDLDPGEYSYLIYTSARTS